MASNHELSLTPRLGGTSALVLFVAVLLAFVAETQITQVSVSSLSVWASLKLSPVSADHLAISTVLFHFVRLQSPKTYHLVTEYALHTQLHCPFIVLGVIAHPSGLFAHNHRSRASTATIWASLCVNASTDLGFWVRPRYPT